MNLNLRTIGILLLVLFGLAFGLSLFMGRSTDINVGKNNPPIVSQQPAFSLNLSAGPVAEGQKTQLDAQANRTNIETNDQHATNQQALNDKTNLDNSTLPQRANSINTLWQWGQWIGIGGMIVGLASVVGMSWVAFLFALVIWILTPKLRKKGDFVAVWSLLNPGTMIIGNRFSPTTYLEVTRSGTHMHTPRDRRIAIAASMAVAKSSSGWRFSWTGFGRQQQSPVRRPMQTINLLPNKGEKKDKKTGDWEDS